MGHQLAEVHDACLGHLPHAPLPELLPRHGHVRRSPRHLRIDLALQTPRYAGLNLELAYYNWLCLYLLDWYPGSLLRACLPPCVWTVRGALPGPHRPLHHSLHSGSSPHVSI